MMEAAECECGARMAWVEDGQEVGVVAGRVRVVEPLTGHLCRHCGLALWDAESMVRVDAELGRQGALSSRVVRTGRMLGTYLRGDLPEVMGAVPGAVLRWVPLGPGRFLVVVDRTGRNGG